jgi:hypothetical protein
VFLIIKLYDSFAYFGNVCGVKKLMLDSEIATSRVCSFDRVTRANYLALDVFVIDIH